MVQRIKPPVKEEDIESSFDVSHKDNQLIIEATHHWDVCRDPSVWSGIDNWDHSGVDFAAMEVEIHREFNYSPRPDSDFDEYMTCYVSKHCDVPDVHGFNSHSNYSHDFPDPWLFTGDEEEFRVVDGYPQERQLSSYWSDEDGYETEEWYEPLFDETLAQLDITTFAYAHHFGLLEESPGPVDQIIDVMEWNYPEAISLEEYKRSDGTEPVAAD